MRLLLALALLLPLSAFPQGKKEKGPPPDPKNLKVLPAMDGERVRQVMRGWNAALGVECVSCHVQGDFASDDNPKKETARMMVTMTRDINGKFADSKQHVTCFTCHRGSTTPPTAPPAAEGDEKK
jgi:hypothetical protein